MTRGLVYVMALLLLSGRAHSLTTKVWFTYKSYLNDPSTWFEMFTLCLAPLATHIGFGMPTIVILGSSKPHWTDLMVLANPVSIVWRYYAIAYRRVRTVNWDKTSIAAANTVFWDHGEWDGSEAAITKAREHLVILPSKAHVGLFSFSSIGTIAITLQGIQALIQTAHSSNQNDTNGFVASLTTIFAPIAVLGLLRFPAAYWISKDFAYAPFLSSEYELASNLRKTTQTSEQELQPIPPLEPYLLGTRHWKAILYRAWWVGSLAGSIGLCLYALLSTFAPKGVVVNRLSTTSLMINLMYLYFAVIGIVTHVMLLFRNTHTSVVIPCAKTWWYKAFTMSILVLAIVTVIFASLETVKSPDGLYTSSPAVNCSSDGVTCVPANVTALAESGRAKFEKFFERYFQPR